MNVIRVYYSTPIGRRVMFVWHYNQRIKSAPLYLAAFCSFDPRLGEYESHLFCETYEHDLQKECYSFLHHVCKESEFRTTCRLSQEYFLSLLNTLGLPDFRPVEQQELF